MRRRRPLVRVLWAAVVLAVGISFVGRPLAMRNCVLAAQAAARTAGGAGARPMDMGHAPGPGTPCPHHDAKCCAPCLACCAGCATMPVPAATPPAGDVALAVRRTVVPATSAAVPPLGGRFLQPPPLGPPTPLAG